MRRTLRSALATTIVALLIPAGSFAQISFNTGPMRQVPTGPAFVSVGDFNGDGIGDAVISSTTRPRVTVLFGSTSGDFSSAIELPVGRNLRANVVGDFNGDHINDIAVTDVTGGRVYLIYGKGENGKNDGTFSTPQPFTAVLRGPVAITKGNFDNKPGLDVATANGSANSFTVFSNAGGNLGLRSLGNFPTGANPRAIIAHDFNGDGLDDLAILDTGTRGTDEVSLYLNSGTGSFQSAVPEHYVVGVGAKAMAMADFNNDGLMDLVVLNTAGLPLNSFSVSVLLAGSNPRFSVPPPIVFSCPSMLTGVPIVCTPQDIQAADFDGDTFTDLAISFSTRATDNSSTTAGFVNAYAGQGDGTFIFATQNIVDLGPRGIAAADVTGDVVPDIVVTEFTTNAARTLQAVTPPPKRLRTPCTIGSQCDSKSCLDNVCCSTVSCPSGQRCDIAKSPPGACAPPGGNGDPCDKNDQCGLRFCIAGFCCGSRTCLPPTQFCNTGVCAGPAANATPCTAPEQCASGNCTDGVCCSDAMCAVGAACNIPDHEGSCFTRLTPGNPCTDLRQCCTDPTDPTNCDPSFCLDGFCCEQLCASTESCGIPGFEGSCEVRPTPTLVPTQTPTPTQTSTPSQTPTPAPNGTQCTTDSNCISTHCTDGACCNVAQCATTNLSCNVGGSAGMCAPKKGIGDTCTKPNDCASNFCNSNGVCAAPPTATPIPTATPVPQGGRCNTTSQCGGGTVCNTDDGGIGICCNQLHCASGFACNQSPDLGTCTRLLPTPTPLKTPGAPCTDGSQCDTGSCVNTTCCTNDQCVGSDRCDIFNFKGSCGPPLGPGESCEKNSDCDPANGLACTGNPKACRLANTPLPTAIPIDPTPPAVNAVIRTGGCAIDDGASDGRALLLLAGLPFALWLRRRDGAQSVRVRR